LGFSVRRFGLGGRQLVAQAQTLVDTCKRAYRRMAMFWHPDRNPSPIAGSEFKRVHAAYELLCDPQRLAVWRQTLAAEVTPGDPVAGDVGDDLVQALILTLEEAALAVSIAKQTLGDLEAGKPSVGLGIALRVAKALGVSLFIAPAGEAGAIVQRIREARE